MAYIRKFFRSFLSTRTRSFLRADMMRFKARVLGKRRVAGGLTKLHLGCGPRKVEGWLNVDLVDSDYDMDLVSARLPIQSNSIAAVVSQHVIEHLVLENEVFPLFKELFRVIGNDGEIWLSCPDMEKICSHYVRDRGVGLLADRQARFPDFSLKGFPSQHMINLLFHQEGEHKNLFDFDLLHWVLETTGFAMIERKMERDLLERFPEFPPRYDDYQSLYVKAIVRKVNSNGV